MKNPWQELPKPLIYLAPMSGVTNTAYRQIMKQFGSDLLFPEFVSIDGLHHGSIKSTELLTYDDCERPIIAQLFGADPALFYEAALRVEAMGFDGIDINFGCPAPKVANNGGGCALLADLGRCRAVIEAVIAAVGGRLPISIKTRVSYKAVHVRDFCTVIADLPIDNITIHGRPFEKPYEGAANLDCIKEAKTLVPFLVIASGNGHTPEAAKYTLEYTGADGIALARGTFGKPWLAQQIKQYLATGQYTQPSLPDILVTMMAHVTLTMALPSTRPFVEIRKVLGWYIRDIPNAAHYRAQLVRVSTVEEIETIVAKIQAELNLDFSLPASSQ
ncbi:MAG: tRNA-dihydrouridine synthase [Candidatus Kerfeldbacteria bacterium]|nr:tRNA-dihydrouridine synthase [Candidatus Kerfeldbacteria bacterium]